MPDPGEEIAHYALKTLGQPFRLNARRFDLSESDCVVFVERCIAMALASDWESYCELCQPLPHKDRKVAFLERSFFTLADWVPNNAWLLDDITDKLGVPTQQFEHVVRRKAFLRNLRFGEDDTQLGRAKAALKAAKIAAAPREERRLVRYIAPEDIPAALGRLRPGDAILVFRRCQRPGLKAWFDCDHMMLVAGRSQPSGEPVVCHSARPQVQKTSVTAFLEAYPAVSGFKILRIRAEMRP